MGSRGSVARVRVERVHHGGVQGVPGRAVCACRELQVQQLAPSLGLQRSDRLPRQASNKCDCKFSLTIEESTDGWYIAYGNFFHSHELAKTVVESNSIAAQRRG